MMDKRSFGSLSIGDDISSNLLNKDAFPRTPPPASARKPQDNFPPSSTYQWKINYFLSKDHLRSPIFQLCDESFSIGFWPRGGMVKGAKLGEGKEFSALSLRYEGVKEALKCKVILKMLSRDLKNSQEGTINDTHLGCLNISEKYVNVQRSVGFERFVKTYELMPENNKDDNLSLIENGCLTIEVELSLIPTTLETLRLEALQHISPNKSTKGMFFGNEDDEIDDMKKEITLPKLRDVDMLAARLPVFPSTKAIVLSRLRDLRDEAYIKKQNHLKAQLKPSLTKPVSNTHYEQHPLTQRPPRPRINHYHSNHHHSHHSFGISNDMKRQQHVLSNSNHLHPKHQSQYQNEEIKRNNNNNRLTGKMFTGGGQQLKRGNQQLDQQHHKIKGDRCLKIDPEASWKPPPGALMGPGNALELPALNSSLSNHHSLSGIKKQYLYQEQLLERFYNHDETLSDEELLNIYYYRNQHYDQHNDQNGQNGHKKSSSQSSPYLSNSWHPSGIRTDPRRRRHQIQSQIQTDLDISSASSSNSTSSSSPTSMSSSSITNHHHHHQYSSNNMDVITGNQQHSSYYPIATVPSFPPSRLRSPPSPLGAAMNTINNNNNSGGGGGGGGGIVTGSSCISEVDLSYHEKMQDEYIPILGKVTITLKPRNTKDLNQSNHHKNNKNKNEKAKINVSYESKPNTPGTFGYLDSIMKETSKSSQHIENKNNWKSKDDIILDMSISSNMACRKILSHMNLQRSENKKIEDVHFIIRDARTGLEFDVDKKSRDQFFFF